MNDSTLIINEEDLLQDITLERINNWMVEAGEDFLDYCGDINRKKFAYEFMGFALARHPEWGSELIDSCNGDHIYTQLVAQVYYDKYEHSGDASDLFYQDLCDFINHTTYTKKKVNQFLIEEIDG